MRTLIQNDDLKRIFTGAAGAVAAGLLLGAAVQPKLTDNILAPQQEMGLSAARTYATGPERGVSAYAGQVPDYVIGTRWIQPQPVAEDQLLAYEERAEPAAYSAASADDYAATAEAAHVTTTWQDEAVEPPHYPSERGSTYYESDLPDPPSDDPRDYEPA